MGSKSPQVARGAQPKRHYGIGGVDSGGRLSPSPPLISRLQSCLSFFTGTMGLITAPA